MDFKTICFKKNQRYREVFQRENFETLKEKNDKDEIGTILTILLKHVLPVYS